MGDSDGTKVPLETAAIAVKPESPAHPAEPVLPPSQKSLRILQRIHALLKRQIPERPYVAAYSIPTPAEGAAKGKIKQVDFPGLLYLQVVSAANDDVTLISMWTSKSACDRSFDDLAKKYEINTDSDAPLLLGSQECAVIPQAGAARRIGDFLWEHKTAAVVFVAGLIAGLAGLLSHVDSIFDWAAQNISAAAATASGGQGELPVGTDQRFTTEFDVQNESSFASSYICISRAEILNSANQAVTDAIELDEFRGKSFPVVKAGESRSLTLSGRAVKPGKYTLAIYGHAKRPRSWWSDGCAEFSASRVINVWMPVSLVREPPEPLDNGNRCRIKFHIAAGKRLPRGAVGTINLAKTPNVELLVSGSDVADGGPQEPNRTPGKEAVSAAWHCGPLDRLDRARGELILMTIDRTPISVDRWKEIAKLVEFTPPVQQPLLAPDANSGR